MRLTSLSPSSPAVNPLTRHLHVLLADRAPPPPPDTLAHRPLTPSARVSTLTPATIGQLARLGAWPRLAPAAAPFDAMAVWDGAGTGAVHYTAADAGRWRGGAGRGGLAGVARGLAATAAAALGLDRKSVV